MQKCQLIAGERQKFMRLFDTGQSCAPPADICWQLQNPEVGNIPMMDVVMLAVGLVFFVLSIAYVYACDLL